MSESGLSYQPLSVDDFSGGMTDLYVAGGPTRYQFADNFFVTVDKMLETRPGSVGFIDYSLPNVGQRVDAFLLFQNEKHLLANQARQLFYLNASNSWTELKGPSGNSALDIGTSFQSMTKGEHQGHLYFTSSAGSTPSKVYFDENGTLQVRTVGLPIPSSPAPYSESSLLLDCIALANSLRSAMLGHMFDLTLHGLLDKPSINYLQAVAFTGSDPEAYLTLPYSPAPAATDQASLFTLIPALVGAYNRHGKDSGGQTFPDPIGASWGNNTSYHFGFGFYVGSTPGLFQFSNSTPAVGPFQTIPKAYAPPTLLDAAATLNVLYTQWNWHRLSVYTHDVANTYTTINVHHILGSPIVHPSLDTSAQPSEDDQKVISYANWLRSAYNLHASNDSLGGSWSIPALTGAHTRLDDTQASQVCTLPEATDLDSAKLVLYWLWAIYGSVHYPDAVVCAGNSNFSCAAVVPTKSLTSVVDDASGALQLNQGVTGKGPNWLISGAGWNGVNAGVGVWNSKSDGTGQIYNYAVATASASGTATTDHYLTNATGPFQQTVSLYHGAYTGGVLKTPTAPTTTGAEILSSSPGAGLLGPNTTLPVGTSGWLALGTQFLTAFYAHLKNAKAHPQASDISAYLSTDGAVALQNSLPEPFYLPTRASYAYALVFKDEYTTQDGLTFQVRSAPIYLGPYETDSILPQGFQNSFGATLVSGGYPVPGQTQTPATFTLTNLPILSNNSLTNYDTGNVQLEIYRTIDSGSVYYLVDSVANGTTTYTDTLSDTLSNSGKDPLNGRAPLYTTGGVVGSAQPLPAKFLHIVQKTAYFGYVYDTGVEFKSRVVQGIPDELDASPANFSDDIEDELKGISSSRETVILFGSKSLYRLGGGVSETGVGSLTHTCFSNEIGCIASGSIVQTEIGCFFAGNDGFYYTDGFQLIKVSIDIDLTYSKLTRSDLIQGHYDRLTRRVYWTAQDGDAVLSDVNALFVYHLNFGVKPSGVFTVWKNGSHFSPSAVTTFQGDLIRGDSRGFVFEHNAQYLSDPKVPSDLTVDISLWGTTYIPWRYRSCAMAFGSIYQGQWVSKVHMLAENKGNVNVQITSISENKQSSTDLKLLAPIRYADNVEWGDARIVWGDPCDWAGDGKLDAWRRFTRGTLRSQLKQIDLSPARIGVYRYDDYPEGAYATLDATAKTATLVTPSGYSALVWPTDVVDLYLAVDTDDYATEYLVTAVTTNSLTFSDAGNLSVDGAAKWVLRGYQKEAGTRVQSYVIQFAELGFRGAKYVKNSGSGENSG